MKKYRWGLSICWKSILWSLADAEFHVEWTLLLVPLELSCGDQRCTPVTSRGLSEANRSSTHLPAAFRCQNVLSAEKSYFWFCEKNWKWCFLLWHTGKSLGGSDEARSGSMQVLRTHVEPDLWMNNPWIWRLHLYVKFQRGWNFGKSEMLRDLWSMFWIVTLFWM